MPFYSEVFFVLGCLDESDWSAVDTDKTIFLDVFTTGWGVLAFVFDSDTDECWDLSALDSNLVENIAGVEET